MPKRQPRTSRSTEWTFTRRRQRCAIRCQLPFRTPIMPALRPDISRLGCLLASGCWSLLTQNRARPFVSSALEAPHVTRGNSMKKVKRATNDNMRQEYDFASMEGGVRGKYVRRLRAKSNLVLLDPELAEAFPTDAAVNEALRAVLKAASVVHTRRRRTTTSTVPRK
jgi:hypothetical protein